MDDDDQLIGSKQFDLDLLIGSKTDDEFNLEVAIDEWAALLDAIPRGENGKMERHAIQIALRVGVLLHRLDDVTKELAEARNK